MFLSRVLPLFLCLCPAWAADTYRLVDLGNAGIAGSTYASAHDINELRQVAITASTSTHLHSLVWSNGTFTELPLDTEAQAINDLGEVTGSFYTANNATVTPFVWHRSLFALFHLAPSGRDFYTLLPLPAGSRFPVAKAVTINNRGQIGGWCEDAQAQPRPCLWNKKGVVWDQNDVPTQLSTGVYTGFSEIKAINDSGVAVGYVTALNGPRGVTWTRGKMVELPAPAGLPQPFTTNAYGINGRGDVVGIVRNQGVVWRNGQSPVYISDATVSDHPLAINDSGTIAGWRVMPQGGAYVWQNGQVTPLPFLAGGGITYAYAINNRGDVAGSAMDANRVTHAVIWLKQ